MKREKSLEFVSLFTRARQGLSDLSEILSFHINPLSKCAGELELYRGTLNGMRLSPQYWYVLTFSKFGVLNCIVCVSCTWHLLHWHSTLSTMKKTYKTIQLYAKWIIKDPRGLYSLCSRCLLINLSKLQGPWRNSTYHSKEEGETSCCLAYPKSAIEQKWWEMHIYEGEFEALWWAIRNVYLEILYIYG